MQWIMDRVGYSQTEDVDSQKSATPPVTPPASQEGIAGESKAAERVEKSSEARPKEDYIQPEARGTAEALGHEAEVPADHGKIEAEVPPDSPQHGAEVPADFAKNGGEVFADPVQREAEIPVDYARNDAEVPADYVQDNSGIPLQQHDADTDTYTDAALPSSVHPSVPREESVAQGTMRSESTKWDGHADEEVLTGDQTLMKVPGTVVHLVDEQESVLLAQGDFVLSRIMQEGREGVIIARVGEQLKWPIVQTESTVKLDRTHYFFAVEAPSATTENPSNMLTLNYGLTLPHSTTEEEDAIIQQLDHYLDRYSTFTAPTIVTGAAKFGVSTSQVLRSEDAAKTVVPEELVSGDGVVAADEQESAAFWTTIAPNVNDYNGKMAKTIASGTGVVIEDIFWLSDAAKAQLDAGHDYMKAKFQPNRESSQVSPATIGAMRSVRKVTETTDKVADGILSGILNVTGSIATKIVESKGGQTVFNTNVGQAALASMEAFGSLFDAVEKAGRNVAAHSSSVTQDFVNHRYGESARQLTDESFNAVGHATSVLWSVVKLHKAFTPTSFAKSSARSAVQTHKKGKTAGAVEEEDPNAEMSAFPDPELNAIPEQNPSASPGKSPSISRLKKVE